MIPELKTFLIAMSPILELRGSIPIALGVYQLPVWSSLLFSIIGNLVPVIFILWLLESVSKFLSRKSPFLNRFFSWLFRKTRENHGGKFQRWKEFALVILVAIPIPFTGAWTGSLCAFVFGIPFKKAFLLITAGVVIAGLVVTLASLGIIKII
jgi:uncharacterized membrane protein